MDLLNLQDIYNQDVTKAYSNVPLTLSSVKERLLREAEHTRYYLALDPGINTQSLQTNDQDKEDHLNSTAEGNIDTHIPQVSGQHSLSESQFLSYLRIAASEARTGRWAYIPDYSDNRALLALSTFESDRNPFNKNPTSTAFGLFQLKDSTWGATGIEKQDAIPTSLNDQPAIINQMVAGIRYVVDTYKTPERALAFQRATVKRDSTNVPSDLLSRWQIWVSKGYAGY